MQSRVGQMAATVVALVIAAASLTIAARAAPAVGADTDPACAAPGWVNVWSMPTSDDGPELAAGTTLREIVYPHLGGEEVRVHLSNRFAATPVTLGSVTVGIQRAGAGVVAGSLTALRFGGKPGVTIPPDGEVTSDPARFTFAGLRNLSVSIYLASAAATPAEHSTAEQADYLSPPAAGDRAGDATGAGFGRVGQTGDPSSPFSSTTMVTGVDAYSASTQGVVVALGDSITDGLLVHGSQTDDRWPDALARRLRAAHLPLSVANAGISGNLVTVDAIPAPMGSPALTRFGMDVLAQAGVRTVILFEGINDIHAGVAVADLEAADTRIIARSHAAGLRILLATLTPSGVAGDGGVDAPATRQRLDFNVWVRSERLADGVIDFDAAVADTMAPTRLAPGFDGGDHLHLSPAGYLRLGDAVPLPLLLPAGCIPAAD